MPGSVSDSYDPEWSTGANASDIEAALKDMHAALGSYIKSPPKYILDVVHGDEGPMITATFSEKCWRVLRFACERAADCI